MVDYIEREAVRNELYDADAITMKGIAILNKFPSADVVKVIRCKDCKHYHTFNRSVRFACKELYCCRSAIKKVSPEDFCSFGERKDND